MPNPPKQASRRARLGVALALLLIAGLATGLTLGLSGGSPSSHANDRDAKNGVESFKEHHPAEVAQGKGSHPDGGANSRQSHEAPEGEAAGAAGIGGTASEEGEATGSPAGSQVTGEGTEGNGVEEEANRPKGNEPSEGGRSEGKSPKGKKGKVGGKSPKHTQAKASFTISGGPSGALTPGASSPIVLTLANPNAVTIYVTSLHAAASGGSSACAASENLAVVQSDVSSSLSISIPAHGSVTLPNQGVSAPTLELRDLPVDQDACASTRFALSYSGSAHS